MILSDYECYYPGITYILSLLNQIINSIDTLNNNHYKIYTKCILPLLKVLSNNIR